MEKRFSTVMLLSVLIVACTILLGGCFAAPNVSDLFVPDDYDEYTSFTDNRTIVSEGFFSLTIHTDKDTFAHGETIDCWAELEYIGDMDSITVYTYGDPITMDMISEDTNYTSSSWEFVGSDETLTLKKGQPLRVTLADSLPKSTSVLPGKYEIDAYASVSLSSDGAASYYASVSAVIVVEK
jgi:hypothetical protein